MGLINESVYGAKNTWLDNPINAQNGNRWDMGKIANFGDNDGHLSKGITNGKTPINAHIDKSLSYCGIGTESNYNHISLYDTKDNWSKKTINVDVSNFFFWTRDNTTFTWTNTNFNMRQYSNTNTVATRTLWSPIDSIDTNNKHRMLMPCVDLPINKIKFLIKVTAATDTTFATQQTFDFQDYKDNHTLDYPIIRKIYGITCNYNNNGIWGDFGSINNNYAGFGVAFFHDYPTSWSDNSISYTCFDKENYNDSDYSVILFGSRQLEYTTALTAGREAICIGECKTQVIGTKTYFYQDDNINDVLESALKTAACFGTLFCLDSTHLQDTIYSDHTYMGVIPDNYITHGEYTHGVYNLLNQQTGWIGTSDSDYDYTKYPVNYSDTSDLHSYYLATAFTKLYAVSVTDMNSLAGAMSTAVQNLSTDVNDVEKAFFTNNPLDVVVSLKRFPFNLTKIATFASGNIKLGVNDTGITSQYLAGLIVPYSFGETYIPYYFNDFRDFEPYTTIDLVIPFCGSVRLSPAVFMGHYLRLKMSVDLFTGACCCYIFRDNLIIDSVSGNCAVDLPVTGIQAADLNNAIMNAVTNSMSQKVATQKNEITAALNMGGFAGDVMLTAMGIKNASNTKKQNIAGIVSGAFSAVSGFAGAVEDERMHAYEIARSQYQLENIQTPFAVVGSASAGCSLVQELNSRLIIHRPVMNPNYTNASADYASINGYATLESGTLSSYTGFTVCTAVDVSGIHATLDETNLIKQALLKGVRIKQVTP